MAHEASEITDSMSDGNWGLAATWKAFFMSLQPWTRRRRTLNEETEVSMSVKSFFKMLWSPFARLNYLLRHSESDTHAIYPDSGLSTKDAAVTDGITGMAAQSHTGHVGL
jgi:hypothetical protein